VVPAVQPGLERRRGQSTQPGRTENRLSLEGNPHAGRADRHPRKLRKYVESHDHAIRLKSEIMVDHFHEQVMVLNKIGGKARAMLVCNGIERAVQYYQAFTAYLAERKSPYQAIVAFSGEHEFGGVKVTESSLNGFPSGDIAEKIQEDPYRFLICADKFQTGYDEPLLHTIKALAKVMLTLLKDDTQVYKQFVENESFKRFVTDMV